MQRGLQESGGSLHAYHSRTTIRRACPACTHWPIEGRPKQFRPRAGWKMYAASIIGEAEEISASFEYPSASGSHGPHIALWKRREESWTRKYQNRAGTACHVSSSLPLPVKSSKQNGQKPQKKRIGKKICHFQPGFTVRMSAQERKLLLHFLINSCLLAEQTQL